MHITQELPEGLTPEARKARERFLREFDDQMTKSREVCFTILVWGQGPQRDTPIAAKRRDIRDELIADGHNAMFSEELSDGLDDLHSLKSHEYAQAQAADLIVILMEGSPGAMGEAHDFAEHPDLVHKVLIMAPVGDQFGYSCRGILRDVADGYGAVHWYAKEAIASCAVLARAKRFVEARRQIEYRRRDVRKK